MAWLLLPCRDIHDRNCCRLAFGHKLGLDGLRVFAISQHGNSHLPNSSYVLHWNGAFQVACVWLSLRREHPSLTLNSGHDARCLHCARVKAVVIILDLPPSQSSTVMPSHLSDGHTRVHADLALLGRLSLCTSHPGSRIIRPQKCDNAGMPCSSRQRLSFTSQVQIFLTWYTRQYERLRSCRPSTQQHS
jgi:hypothetical protein